MAHLSVHTWHRQFCMIKMYINIPSLPPFPFSFSFLIPFISHVPFAPPLTNPQFSFYLSPLPLPSHLYPLPLPPIPNSPSTYPHYTSAPICTNSPSYLFPIPLLSVPTTPPLPNVPTPLPTYPHYPSPPICTNFYLSPPPLSSHLSPPSLPPPMQSSSWLHY